MNLLWIKRGIETSELLELLSRMEMLNAMTQHEFKELINARSPSCYTAPSNGTLFVGLSSRLSPHWSNKPIQHFFEK